MTPMEQGVQAGLDGTGIVEIHRGQGGGERLIRSDRECERDGLVSERGRQASRPPEVMQGLDLRGGQRGRPSQWCFECSHAFVTTGASAS